MLFGWFSACISIKVHVNSLRKKERKKTVQAHTHTQPDKVFIHLEMACVEFLDSCGFITIFTVCVFYFVSFALCSFFRSLACVCVCVCLCVRSTLSDENLWNEMRERQRKKC